MTFFDSDVVRAEIVHINELQEKLYNKMFSFYTMNKQDKLDHVELLKTLIEKQKVLYHYNVREKQFRRFVKDAKRGIVVNWTDKLFSLLEMRLDNLVFRLGFEFVHSYLMDGRL